jgi:hypothetical protein
MFLSSALYTKVSSRFLGGAEKARILACDIAAVCAKFAQNDSTAVFFVKFNKNCRLSIYLFERG